MTRLTDERLKQSILDVDFRWSERESVYRELLELREELLELRKEVERLTELPDYSPADVSMFSDSCTRSLARIQKRS